MRRKKRFPSEHLNQVIIIDVCLSNYEKPRRRVIQTRQSHYDRTASREKTA